MRCQSHPVSRKCFPLNWKYNILVYVGRSNVEYTKRVCLNSFRSSSVRVSNVDFRTFEFKRLITILASQIFFFFWKKVWETKLRSHSVEFNFFGQKYSQFSQKERVQSRPGYFLLYIYTFKYRSAERSMCGFFFPLTGTVVSHNTKRLINVPQLRFNGRIKITLRSGLIEVFATILRVSALMFLEIDLTLTERVWK